MRRDRRQPDYVNLVAGFYVWRAVVRVIGAVGAVVFIGLYMVLYAIDPSDAPDIAAYGFFALMVAGLLGIVYGVFRLFARPRPRPEWVPHGAIANPTGDFFDDQGRRLWERKGNAWVRLETPRYEK